MKQKVHENQTCAKSEWTKARRSSKSKHIFLSFFSLLRTLFSVHHLIYVHYLKFCTISSFQQRTFLRQKLWYCFRLVKSNLIFIFGNLWKLLPGKIQPRPNFLIPTFNYRVLFDEHNNVIKIFHIFKNSVDVLI